MAYLIYDELGLTYCCSLAFDPFVIFFYIGLAMPTASYLLMMLVFYPRLLRAILLRCYGWSCLLASWLWSRIWAILFLLLSFSMVSLAPRFITFDVLGNTIGLWACWASSYSYVASISITKLFWPIILGFYWSLMPSKYTGFDWILWCWPIFC